MPPAGAARSTMVGSASGHARGGFWVAGRALSPVSRPFHHFPWYISRQKPQLLTSTGERARKVVKGPPRQRGPADHRAGGYDYSFPPLVDGVIAMSHKSAPPDAIYIIRHGEKPQDLAPKHPEAHSGVDFRGRQNEHSLLPRGWQRSGALAALFDPSRSPLRTGLQVPRMLISPSYGHASATA